MADNIVLTYLERELKRLRESNLDHILELYFLETGGNLIDFHGFKKKVVNNELLQYLSASAASDPNRLMSEEELKELIALKSSLDVTNKPLETPVSEVVLPSTPIVTQVISSNASTTDPTIAISSPQSVAVVSSHSSDIVITSLTSTKPNQSGTNLATTPPTNKNLVGGTPSGRAPTRQHSISSFYDASIGSQEQIVERARQEAYVVQRITDLRKNGLWSSRRLPKVQEPFRSKTHWDYLLEEMQWLATDFAQERKWKKAAAKKCAKMVMKYHSDKKCSAEKAEKDELLRMRKIASNIAKQIRQFWSDVEKVFEAKQEVRLKEKRKKLHDMHLNFIVDKADKYTERLTQELGKTLNTTEEPVISTEVDKEFEPENSESDDEETIAKEEEEDKKTGVEDHNSEIELLKKESEIPIEDLRASLPKEIIEGSADNDNEFEVEDEDVEDEEDTIEEEEKIEGKVDHSNELLELQNDMNLSVEELKSKYYTNEDSSQLDSDDDQDMECDDEETEENEDNTCEEDFEDDISTEEEAEEIGMEFLINPDAKSDEKPLIEEISDNNSSTKTNVGPNREITDIAGAAESLQPKGHSLLTTEVKTNVPFLLKHELREYQHIGLDWLVAMQDKKLNGILADEMGLGKTIQTIALIAHLACDKGIWGPHLIVVPTSVMLNWEMEFKKWCPAFKILTYYGSPKERKLKRQGWTKPNQFHVCITSYKLVIQDHQSFRRKKWKYLILDEAQHIKNFKSQRWQMLLNFNTSRRLLLTGTPLQNNLMELWSLMHFLMPNVFQSHKEFKDWFVNPVTGMVEGNNEFNEGLIRRLHKVLRPFLLRRLKCDVEKQLPKKYEHIIMCSLSKRQRYLYEEFMSLTKTKETLLTGNFLSVINILMQLRKVCNHPNLFDPRPTISPLMTEPITYETASLVTTALDYDPLRHINLKSLNLVLSDLSFTLSAFAHHRIGRFMATPELIQEIDSSPETPPRCPRGKIRLQIRTSTMHSTSSPKPISSTSSALPSSNRQIEQKFLMAGIPSQNNLTPKLTPGITSSPEGNRMAIPLGRLVQTPAGPHILLRTSSGTPISSTIPPSIIKQSQSPQNPMRQIIVRSVQPNIVGVANSQEQQLVSSPVTPSSKTMPSSFQKQSLIAKQLSERKEKLSFLSRINQRKCSATALYATDLLEVSTINSSLQFITKSIPTGSSVFNVGNGYLNCRLASHSEQQKKDFWKSTNSLNRLIRTPETIVENLKEVLNRFLCIVPRVMSPPIQFHASHHPPSKRTEIENLSSSLSNNLSDAFDVLQTPISQNRLQFPELRLIQYDCGKLHILNRLLWDLRTGGHRVLIFTQMSRMLDIFEQFLNHNGHTYLRLDGTTKIEQRQALMERFNADKRIFCFILSTRSGGIGVNLTGADTVIFYDSDWNPTMDAQAQDRCHRIGQTRDVHIYRLISEMTIEENILKKAQQKKLLGSVAIEGGNFTTAFFKQNAIQDLFGIDLLKDTSIRGLEAIDSNESTNETILDAQLEQALGTVEEDNDVVAAKTARAEAAAEYAEFDENIPIDADKEEEKSPEEEQIDQLIEQLTPVEKYAMNVLEVFQESLSFEQLKQAEEEIEAHKKEWELGRIQAEKEEALRREEAMEEEREPLLSCHREDAYNQVFISYNGFEQMPIWAPPTPPQDENDIYIDYSLGFLYEQTPIPESLLPPVYVPKESNKRLKLDTTIARKQKVRKEEGFNIPRSLFDRPSTSIIKLRRELILQKLKAALNHGPENAAILRTLNALGGSCLLPVTNILPSPSHKIFGGPLQDSIPSWAIHEDWAIVQVIQNFQDLPSSLSNISPGHIPNWDLVSDVVNVVSNNFRSPKLCRYHYEVAIIPREEGKGVSETPKQKQKKLKGLTTASTSAPSGGSVAIPTTTATIPKQTPLVPSVRPVKTSSLISRDNNMAFSQLCNQRFETIKQIANKRTPTLKHMFVNTTSKNPKHIALLTDSGINLENPLTPLQVAANRAERIQKEKQKAVADQQMAQQQQQHAARQLQQQIHQKQQQSTQIKTILSQNPNMPTAQHQLSQAISAKISQINQSNLKAASASGATSVTQLSLNKALSQVNVATQPMPQPILSQINVSPQTIGSTNVTNTEGIPQGLQQTCSVVSVAALTPHHQKLIAAVSPAVSQMGGQSIAGRLTTANPQIYKQIILRQQQQSQQIQRQQQSPQIQMQTIPQSNKQIANIGVGQQPRFQITATVTQPGVQHTTQSLIATTSGLKVSQPSIVTTLPVAVPMTATQQRITTTTSAGKPTQQIITRTITDPQLAQIIKRQQMQSSGNLGQTQILVQQSSPQTQSSQSQTQILQNPVTFVKTLSSPASMATQSLTIPITMTGMNIFTSPVSKVVSATAANSNIPTSSTITSVPATQLRQIQLLQQKRPQQTTTQVIQQQQLQSQLSQQLGQNTHKITTTTIAGQPKTMAQIQGSPMGTFQILHQSSPTSQNVQTAKTVPTTVTVQQLQQALKQGLVVGPHNLSHTIHVSQSGNSSTTSGTTLIPQSILQAVSQSKTAQTIESSQQSTPIAVAQIGGNQQTVKHIQVVSSASAQNQSSGSLTPKSIIISGQPTILQTSLPSQPQTVTFAIRAATQQTTVGSQTTTNTISTAQISDINLSPVVKDEPQDPNDSSRPSPYATRHRTPKN